MTLDILAEIGSTTTDLLWAPVLAWTVLTLPVWVLSRRTERLHPHMTYRLHQVLLATLPVGIVAAALIEWAPGAAVVSSVTSLPALMVGEAASAPALSRAGAALSWRWTQAMGLLTIGAGLASAWALGRLILDAWAAVRVRASASTLSSLPSSDTTLPDSSTAGRTVRVRLHPDASVPMTLAGAPPVILLPPSLVEHPDALRMALAHEQVHLRRYDDVAHVLERLVAALFAAHPLVWGLQTDIAWHREQACDAAVLDGGQVSPASYARLLTRFATGTATPAGALSLSESSSLLDRLRTMRTLSSLSPSSPYALTGGVVAVGLALVLGVAACSDSLTGSTDTAPPPETATSQTQRAGDSTYVVVEDPPKLKGGLRALQERVVYPDMARKAGIEGRVFVQFVVTTDGTVASAEVTRGAHRLLNEEALRVIRQMEFEPGRQQGTPVRVRMSLPVTFRLPNDSASTSDADQAGGSPDMEITFHELSPRIQERISGGPVFSERTIASLSRGVERPKLLRKAGIKGTVEVTFRLSESGEARNPSVTKSVHEALDTAVLRSVQRTTFSIAEWQSVDLAGKEITIRLDYGPPDVTS